jgi:ParB-like chromosome segregation protein Spo0J
MRTKLWRVEDLREPSYNPRTMTDGQRAQLQASLAEFGVVVPIVVNTHPGREGVVVGGNQRVAALREAGEARVPAVEVDLAPERERALCLRLNRNTGEWDHEKLQAAFSNDELLAVGFEGWELGIILPADEDPLSHDVDAEAGIHSTTDYAEPRMAVLAARLDELRAAFTRVELSKGNLPWNQETYPFYPPNVYVYCWR